MRKYNDGEVRACLKLHLARNYELKAHAAEEWGIGRSYLSQILKGDSPVPGWLLDILGFERVEPEPFYRRNKR